MASPSDFPARGKIFTAASGMLTFRPANTNYEIHVKVDSSASATSDKSITGTLRVNARKVYTVPSGGNFISPLFGPPKIIQGRVKYLDEKMMVVQAGCPVVVNLPIADSAIDLDEGQITVGALVNVVALPGATFATLSPGVR